jgi:hypothetical protein
MSIVGGRPESGVRIEVERPQSGGPPWRYEGEAATPQGRMRLAAQVEGSGDVTVELGPLGGPADGGASAGSTADGGASAELRERVRLMIRAAWKHAEADSLPPPRRIVRWRPDR